jgi:hypothetical protein
MAFLTEAVNTIDDIDGDDPTTIKEAMRSKNWPEWLAAIHLELASLDAMGVYTEVDCLPPGKKAVGSKWVLAIKRDQEGTVAKYKARLVAKGFDQIPGQDFTHTFAPVARWESIRFVLYLAAVRDLELRHIDIKTAYLNGVLKEDVYMRRPEMLGDGFWKLNKAIYGLKQAGREWYFNINSTYTSMGMKRCESDWSVHYRIAKGRSTITTTSVDDILAASTSKEESDLFTSELEKNYSITDNHDVTWILGCRITRWRNRRSLKLDQERYTISILEEFHMENCNITTTPMIGLLTKDNCPKTEMEIKNTQKLPYRELVGKLMYLATCTRPDIAFAVRELAKFMSNYGEPHWKAAKHLLRYLQGTRSYGIYYGQVDNPYPLFKVFTDSDWAQGENRKSVCGFVVMMEGGPIAWSSKQQGVVALSSCEAEYIACTHAAKTLLWCRSLAKELGFEQQIPTTLFCDNQGTIACTRDPQHHTRMKHIDIRFHFIRDCVQKETINVTHIPTAENAADFLTKPLGRILHRKWTDWLQMGRDQGGVSK